jgi:hypothetical protein
LAWHPEDKATRQQEEQAEYTSVLDRLQPLMLYAATCQVAMKVFYLSKKSSQLTSVRIEYSSITAIHQKDFSLGELDHGWSPPIRERNPGNWIVVRGGSRIRQNLRSRKARRILQMARSNVAL